MDQEALEGTNLAGALNAGLFLDPVEQRLDGLAEPRDRGRVEPIGGVQAFLPLLLFDRGQDLAWEVGIPGEVFVGLVGISLPIDEHGCHDLQCRAVVHSGRSDADITGEWQRAGPVVANGVNFDAVVVQLLGGTVAAVGQFLTRHLGVEPPALLGQDHRLGIDQADVGSGGV